MSSAEDGTSTAWLAASQCWLETIDIAHVTDTQRSAVHVSGPVRGMPTVLVHGILDNVWRWLTAAEAARFRLELPEPRPVAPLFHPQSSRLVAGVAVPQPWHGQGLLECLRQASRPAVAYSYQAADQPVADMDAAVEKLHRVILWAKGRYEAERINLVGHSRGGLVCRHALVSDSPVMRAEACRRSVQRLIAVCAPHAGSRLAVAIGPLRRGFGMIQSIREKLAGFFPSGLRPTGTFLARLLENLAQLTPEAEEVRLVAAQSLPPLPGGYYAIAGSDPAYVSWRLPVLGEGKLPPSLPAPWRVAELTPGQGDMAVSVDSALDIPDPSPERTCVLPLNHLNITFDARTHRTIMAWLEA